MGCLNCRVQLLSEQINCSIEAKDLLNVYLQLLNKDVVIDNELKKDNISVEHALKNSLSISTETLNITIVNKSLDKVQINNKYIDLDNKTILVSNRLIDKLKIEFKDYVTDISNDLIRSIITIDNIYTKNVNFINTLIDKVSIRHSMLCNIKEHILLISEDEELIIDESGNFFIEISEY